MADVARRAGVSQKTVSRVVNGEAHVSRAVRERVLREIERLGFLPNENARALVTRKSRRIGVLTTSPSYHGPAALLDGLERAAREAGYFVSIVHVHDGAARRPGEGQPGGRQPGAGEREPGAGGGGGGRPEDDVRRAVVHLVSQGVDGIVISAPVTGSADLAAAVPAGIPVLAMDFPEGGPRRGALVVANDDAGGARAITAYLLGLGHRTVHHLAGPPHWAATSRRLRGWRAALQAAGAPVPEPRHGDWSPASGYRAARELLAETGPSGMTALFAANDQMAIGALHALERSGRSVPRDVSVAGFDDIPEAAYLTVPLTTVRQDFRAAAGQGMRRLVSAMAGTGEQEGEELITPALVVRESTAGPLPPGGRRDGPQLRDGEGRP
ncbi:LacI family DNA-binding transcriptional regulator [Streptomyces hoynatensis]|uniref:LacI family DNA-binding transcriptional regulator n=2 Tax=Streptomyces hoynatensis TaxID=1141874 RepID=A0A3A9YUQ3_9ACTN|nr:LacI family DNA-binding transcriptional regulator [Streptomyces hoynatensis]